MNIMQSFSFSFFRSRIPKLLAEILLILSASIYSLALPAFTIGNNLTKIDALIPLEAGFCVSLSVLLMGLTAFKIKELWQVMK